CHRSAQCSDCRISRPARHTQTAHPRNRRNRGAGAPTKREARRSGLKFCESYMGEGLAGALAVSDSSTGNRLCSEAQKEKAASFASGPGGAGPSGRFKCTCACPHYISIHESWVSQFGTIRNEFLG